MPRRTLLVGSLWLCACASGTSTLTVDVVTDLCPEVDGAPRCLEARFDTVVVSLDRGLTVARAPRADDDYLEGQRVAALRELEPGTYALTVELLESGVLVARASRSIEIVHTVHSARVVLSSECAGVRCPGPSDDPAATECVSGQCVDPSCFDAPASCGPLCASDAECVASVACGEARCVENVCIEILRDARCGAGERCLRELGCFGGVLEGDPCTTADDCGATDFICCGNECRQPDCDDGNPCTDDACTREGCVNDPIDAACDDHVYCNGADSCRDGTCSVHVGDPCPGGTSCVEASAACVSCTADADCPGASEAPVGGCGGFDDTCDESGTQAWRVTTYRCVASSCVAEPRDEMRACTRDRTGVSCGSGDETCRGGACVCGSSACGAGQYCRAGACWDTPRFELIGQPTASCVDASRGPDPGAFLGYRVYARPGARVHKYNRHASCGGAWSEAPETASSAVYTNASGVYEVLIDTTDPLPCTFETLGLFEQYVDVDGIRVPSSGALEQVIYNSAGCGSALSTCSAARTYCP